MGVGTRKSTAGGLLHSGPRRQGAVSAQAGYLIVNLSSMDNRGLIENQPEMGILGSRGETP